MENIIEYTLVALGLLLFFFQNNAKIFSVLLTVTGVSLLLLLSNGFTTDPSVPMMLYALSGVLILGLIVSFLPEKWAKNGLILAVGLPALLPIGAKAVFQEFEMNWDFKAAVFVMIGSYIPFLVAVKQYFGEKWFNIDVKLYDKAVKVIFLSFLAFGALFLFSTFGLVLLAVGLLAGGIASRDKDLSALGVAAFGISWVIAKTTGVPEFDFVFLKGNFWMGLIAGFGLALLDESGKKSRFLISWLIPVLIGIFFIALGRINPNFGGIPTLIGLVLGLSLSLFSNFNSRNTAETVFPLLFFFVGIHGVTAKLLEQKKVEVKTLIEQPKAETAAKEVDIFELETVPLEAALAGSWKSVAESSKLTFELGPKGGRTSGAIRKFSVDMQINAAGEPEKLNVAMDAVSLTTYDDIRDESVLSEEFIDTEEHPSISWKATRFTKKGENYAVDGELTFMGVTKKINLEIRFVSNVKKDGKEYLVFVGKSQLDRVAFGMSSDPKIGNVVDIQFEVALVK